MENFIMTSPRKPLIADSVIQEPYVVTALTSTAIASVIYNDPTFISLRIRHSVTWLLLQGPSIIHISFSFCYRNKGEILLSMEGSCENEILNKM